MNESSGNAITWEAALRYSFGGWMTWVPLTLGLYWVVKRYPISRDRMLGAIAIQSVAVGLAVFLKAAYMYQTNAFFEWYETLPDFGTVLVASVHNNLMLAWTVVGVAHAFVYYQQSRQRDKLLAKMEQGLVTARLDLLKAQMRPHFLFNALSSVAEMVHKDAALADEMLVSLSALLRDGMRNNASHWRPLGEEVELARNYLMIEKIRLGDRLDVRWQIDEECLDTMVPVLILQPLVENAIIHGISRRKQTGQLVVTARRTGRNLSVVVENSVGPDQGNVSGNGIALSSASNRLALLYGDRASLARRDNEGGRHVVELVIPLDAPQDAEAA